MADKPLGNGYSFKNASLSLGGDAYVGTITQAELQPSSGSSIQTIDGKKSRAEATWALALGLIQDDASTGLLTYLFENEGDAVPFILTPRAGGTAWSGTVVLTPATIGGAPSDTNLTSTVTLDVEGKPTRTPAGP